MNVLRAEVRRRTPADYRGYGGQLILDVELTDAIIEQFGIEELRRAAREVARGFGWQPRILFSKGRFFLYDAREVPHDVRTLMTGRAGADGCLMATACRLGEPIPVLIERFRPDAQRTALTQVADGIDFFR